MSPTSLVSASLVACLPGLAGGLLLLGMVAPARGDDGQLQLKLRSRVKVVDARGTNFLALELKQAWAPGKTALIICDMWDDHWCQSAARRVAEMAGPLNQVVKAARAQGVFIIHAPSSVVAFYQDTPQRKRALAAPLAQPPVPLATAERWGTTWCWPEPAKEGPLPIDDSDMGCDCPVKCEIREAWKRQVATIKIAKADAITDNGQETYNLLQARGIEHVILAGVHLNMCVLGRPFGIRQMVNVGKKVALLRDLTDTMYDPRQAPQVSHFAGTELVIEHVEKYWCPTFTSADLTGRAPFRFKANPR